MRKNYKGYKKGAREMIDFHTHLLPGIDDGSRNVEETQSILEGQAHHGIKTVVATPHFYPDHQIETFVQKRQEAREKIEEGLQKTGIDLRLGAEVLLSVDTWKLEGVEALCIEGTRYILVELPYTHWSDWVYTSVQKLIDNKRFIPILAHVERYEDVEDNPNCLIPFIEMGCLLQMNAKSLHPESTRRKLCTKLVKHKFIHLLGSDVHRGSGLYSIDLGYEALMKVVEPSYIEKMHRIGEMILEDKKVTIETPQPFKKRFGRWYW